MLFLSVAPRRLGLDQPLEPIGEGTAILLRKALRRRFDGRSHAHVHRGFARFLLWYLHSSFLTKRSG